MKDHLDNKLNRKKRVEKMNHLVKAIDQSQVNSLVKVIDQMDKVVDQITTDLQSIILVLVHMISLVMGKVQIRKETSLFMINFLEDLMEVQAILEMECDHKVHQVEVDLEEDHQDL